jgi:uracil-DNA glycosylase family 4
MTTAAADPTFDLQCRRCERLVDFLDDVRSRHPTYHAAPVAPFGEATAPVLIVGLAPGMHGANATGRPFTGDHAGILLYETLFAHGMCNQARGDRADDGLVLKNCRITNAVKCLPPANKPDAAEINACNVYLAAELERLPRPAAVVALGRIAHNAILKALRRRQVDYRFGHGAEHALGEQWWLVDSYHCSRYNTQTKRLTPEMFSTVFAAARRLAEL